jgi:kynureninase
MSATPELARARDAADPLAYFRAQFARPRDAEGRDLVYLGGHSLGLAPLAARDLVNQEMMDWERLGVLGHEGARRAWIGYAERARAGLARLVGAEPADVVAMNSLTVNLHLMLACFYRPGRGADAARNLVLIESGAFSSDRQAIASQIAWHGLDPATTLLELASDPTSGLVDEAAVEAAIAAAGERLALVLWPGVQYRTGQAFDCGRIARAAHAVGALAGFDHAHAIGNLPLALHADDADFAVWCSYKYLNAGPGALAGAFVHPRHHAAARLQGWWGHEAATRFAMQPGFVPEAGAAGWALSNPPIFSAAPLLASLGIFDAAGIAPLRRKSVELTAYAAETIELAGSGALRLVTPADPARRGCALTLEFVDGPARAHAVFEQLLERGVVGDLRGHWLRLAPVPLYTSFEEIHQLGARLQASLVATA